ncbi:hypothetical protein [Paludisphaera rhizosphaerae]|uniref:hypothetical protein n=1 Tax=Paludisphaera rhizosphaerae TaxID=2711216 RepID=UPI0013EB2069|nr:hypothetical protein [Paludisphaera rhizosphaerae]
MSPRLEFEATASAEGADSRELRRRCDVGPEAACKWIARHREIEVGVLGLGDEHPDRGGRKPRRRLIGMGRRDASAAGIMSAKLRRDRQADAAAFARFEHDALDSRWQMDFKGDFTAAGRHPLAVLDGRSRLDLGVFSPTATIGPPQPAAS